MSHAKALKFSLMGVFVWMLASAPPAAAWIDTGHRIISLIAWADLTPAARAKIAETLQQHPRYKEDLLAGLPADAAEADTDRYAFGMASTWPDVVRNQANPMHAAYNHPAWHYIDIPYCIGGQTAQPPPQTGPGPHNVVEALAKSTADLKNPALAARDKAIALCWVLHLCGDIHQPLHACSLFSPQFPDGDQGGNAFYVLREPPYPDSRMKLHLLWDELPGQYKSEEICADLAAALRADPRYGRSALKDALAITDFAAWANESHELAIHYAYRDGTLVGAAASESSGADQEPPGLPRGYLKQAEEIAMRRVALAGYRTADLLTSIFDAK